MRIGNPIPRTFSRSTMKHAWERISGLGGGKRRFPFSPVRRRAFPGLLAYVYAAIVGLFLSLLVSFVLSGYVMGRAVATQRELAQVIAGRPASIFETRRTRPKDDVNFSAFDVGADSGKEAEPDKRIDSFHLVGTLPNIGAWIETEGNASLVLKDQDFNGYSLALIDTGRVLLVKDGENFPLYLNYSNPAGGAREGIASRPVPPVESPPPPEKKPVESQISQAVLNGADGTITRELLDELLMNPYGEIAKVRLVPTEDGSGMTVASMQPDSLLGQLGVKQGDTLTGINGVTIKDVGNLSNAINSMLTGARLDFQVVRDKEPGKLGYVVK